MPGVQCTGSADNPEETGRKMDKHTFTHLDEKGGIQMVDISTKPESFRTARAKGIITLAGGTIEKITSDRIPKGNVLTTAKIAAITAAKKTYEAIPLCHQIRLEAVDVDFSLTETTIESTVTVKCSEKTGAEMEALHAVTLSLLTIYDMCKAVDKNMIIGDITLCSKSKTSV